MIIPFFGRGYYTEQDRQREQEVAEIVSNAWRVQLFRLNGVQPIDWQIVIADTVVGFLELKCQNRPFENAPTTMLSTRKFVQLQMAAMNDAAAPIFMTRFSCGAIRWIDIRMITPI